MVKIDKFTKHNTNVTVDNRPSTKHLHHSKEPWHCSLHKDSRVTSLEKESNHTHTSSCIITISLPSRKHLSVCTPLHTAPLYGFSQYTPSGHPQSQAMFNQSGLTMGASPPGPMDTSGYLPPFLLGTPATKSVCLYIWHTLDHVLSDT